MQYCQERAPSRRKIFTFLIISTGHWTGARPSFNKEFLDESDELRAHAELLNNDFPLFEGRPYGLKSIMQLCAACPSLLNCEISTASAGNLTLDESSGCAKMLTAEMARCIAKISGDGCLYYRYIRYNNTCKELLEEFITDVRKEFNHFRFTYGITNTRTPFVQIHGKQIIAKFLEFLPSYKSEDVNVPVQIFEASEQAKCAYLRALFDDEGSVGIRIFAKTGEWKRNIKIDSKSYALLERVKAMLLEFGIHSNNIRRCDKEDKYWYYLGISRRENFSLFASKIGFTHPLKQQKLILLLKTYKMTYRRNYANFLKLKEELKKLLKPHQAAQ